MTEDSYVMRNKNGGKSQITKDQLDDVTCLKKEKSILEKKAEEKEDYMMKLLKSELIKEKKIMKVKEKINEKDKKIQKFLKNRNDGIKYLENERYLDHQDVQERQKLFQKIMSNYDKKVNIAKNPNSKSKEKMEELKEQIKDYENKNEIYKQKITKIFDLKDTENMQKIFASSPTSGRGGKYVDLEEKFEIERMRRENALMSNMNQFQKKIDGYLEKNEEKEKKIQDAIKKEEKKRENKRILKTMHFEEVREKIKEKQKKYEKLRKKKLENLEQKDLKDFAVMQEKIRMYEERKKMNQLNAEEREIMKNKLKEMINSKKINNNNINNLEIDENLINNIIYN